MFTCPVCGYDKLRNKPDNSFEICPCCGTEFGNDDDLFTHEQLRRQWIVDGAKWWSPYNPKPPFWNYLNQLEKAGIIGPEGEKA